MLATTTKEVEEVLIKAKTIIQTGNFILSMRSKNKDFLKRFGLKQTDIKEIVKDLNLEDFCEKRKSNHSYHQEEVFIFAPIIDLIDNFGMKYRKIQIYLKFSFLKERNVFVISFHLPLKKLNYYFEDRKG